MEKPATRSSGQPLFELKDAPELMKKVTEEESQDPSEKLQKFRSTQRNFGFLDMRPLPSYSGKKTEDVDLWIDKVKSFQKARAWDDEETLSHVLTVLDGRALEAVHSVGDASLGDVH